jgi:two-component system, cell cycle sensor histidine kinase and response regulator CckA
MRYRAIVEHLDDAVFVCDLGGRILDVNTRALSLIGCQREELLNRPFGDFTGPPKRLRWTEEIAARLEGNRPVRGEYTLKLRASPSDRSLSLPISITATCIQIEGQATLISLVVRDQSEREHLQRELWSRNMRLQTILENAAEAIVATDLSNAIVEWNHGATELFGYSREEILGRSIEILVPDDLSADHKALRNRLLQGDIVRDYLTERLHKDGRRLKVSVSRALIRGEHGELLGTSSIMRDVTDRQRAEEMILRGQKMESLGTMAGGIAHDFNNILGVILSFASALLLDGPSDPDLKEDLRVIVQSAERGADLARQLLTLSKPKDGHRERVDLGSIVGFVEKILSRVLDRRISLSTEVDHELPKVMGERTKIEQILLNLCLNARDSMPEGGTIRLEVRRRSLDEEAARRLGGRPGDYVVLRVIDTGCGMDRDTLSRIFDPYFTTKGRGRGTGLGLTMVYAIVQGHDGFLAVESALAQGSTFEVFLPAAPEAEATLASGAHLADENTPMGGTVLLVDDEEDLRRAGRRILGRHGYQILTASDGEEALQIYQSRAGEIDLVLLDMVMPKLDGRAVFRRLRALDPDVKIMLLSGYTPDGGVEDLLAEGLLQFIKKPFSADVLLSEVRKAIEG